jgi:hypothetical protein
MPSSAEATVESRKHRARQIDKDRFMRIPPGRIMRSDYRFLNEP